MESSMPAGLLHEAVTTNCHDMRKMKLGTGYTMHRVAANWSNIGIFVTVLHSGQCTPDVRVWVAYEGAGPDELMAKLGFQPKIDRNMPRETILALWKQEMNATTED
jgi:hypothetical protein